MALVTIKNVGISGICACVPPRVIDNYNYSPILTAEEAKRVVLSTGIKERRFADVGVCGSDLAYQAGKKLIADMQIDPESIDLLVYLTQTPDYMLIPPTSCILQHRLGLPKTTGAYDINMNCSGFAYALNAAFAHANTKMRVLLLVGETLSRVASPEDRSVSMLFGDAGAALLIEQREDCGQSYFSLNTDGEHFREMIVEAGGYRRPASSETIEIRTYEDGSRRSLHHGAMNGAAVFDFTQRVVLPDIHKLLNYANLQKEDIDIYFFHQANQIIIEMFRMIMEISPEKSPITLDRYGNTSTVSIPLGIAADFGKNQPINLGKVLISVFGGGLSWGSCIVDINHCYVGKVEDYVNEHS